MSQDKKGKLTCPLCEREVPCDCGYAAHNRQLNEFRLRWGLEPVRSGKGDEWDQRVQLIPITGGEQEVIRILFTSPTRVEIQYDFRNVLAVEQVRHLVHLLLVDVHEIVLKQLS